MLKSVFNRTLCIIALINLSNLYSQVKEKKYFPVALTLGSDVIGASNQLNAVDYKYKTVASFNFGINWRAWDGNKIVVDAGLLVRSHGITNTFKLGSEDVPENIPHYGGSISDSPYTQYKVPVKISYKLINSDKVTLLMGLGPELIICPKNVMSGLFNISEWNSKVKYGYTENGGSGKVVQPGLLVNAEIDFKTKYISICPHLEYYYAPGDLYTITVSTENLTSNTVTQHSIKNSYFGFGVSLYPAKSIFKGRKK